MALSLSQPAIPLLCSAQAWSGLGLWMGMDASPTLRRSPSATAFAIDDAAAQQHPCRAGRTFVAVLVDQGHLGGACRERTRTSLGGCVRCTRPSSKSAHDALDAPCRPLIPSALFAHFIPGCRGNVYFLLRPLHSLRTRYSPFTHPLRSQARRSRIFAAVMAPTPRAPPRC